MLYEVITRKMNPNQYVVFEGIREHLGQGLHQILISGLALFFFVLPLTLIITQFSEINQNNNLAASTRWQVILAEPIPKFAILLSNRNNFV